MKRILTIAVALAAGLLVLGGQALAAPPDLVVDDDGAQCENADYDNIQDAVDAAADGEKIRVCPGLYEESVQVDKPLFLRGQGPGLQKRSQSGEGDSGKEAIVDPPDSEVPGFDVIVDDVKIKGFTVTGAENAPGIQTSAENSGYEIRKNLIRDNTFGLYFNSSGEFRSRAEKNVFRNNTVTGSATSNGIYSDQGLVDSRIRRNFFTGHENASIIIIPSANAGTRSQLDIDKNKMEDDAALILSGVTDSEVDNNESVRSNTNGIQLGFGGGGSESGVTGVKVRNNKVSDGGFSGINVFSSSDNNFNGNEVEDFGDGGIRLRDSSDENEVKKNEVFENGGADNGISLETGSSDNTIENNTARGNQQFDCNDDSGATAETVLNTWENNIGRTDDPNGLCQRNRN